MALIDRLWISLCTTPLFWLAVTLAAYMIGGALQRACGASAFASPVLTAISIVASIVVLTRTNTGSILLQPSSSTFYLDLRPWPWPFRWREAPGS